MEKKNYNNYVEIVGNVAKVRQTPTEKNGDMRIIIIAHRKYTKKDGTEQTINTPVPVLIAGGRKWANQDKVTVGAALRIKGHLEDNSYKAEDGTWKGGLEVNADSIRVIERKKDGEKAEAETEEDNQK